MRQFIEKQFDCFPFEGKWRDSFAEPEKNFRMIVYGKPGNGKTEFCVQMAKYVSQFAKVYYNTYEQGVSKSMQDALKRNDMMEAAGKVMFGDRETLPEMMKRLRRRNSAKIVFIDSRDFINLTQQQYKQLDLAFPSHAFVIVCWESNGKPKGEHAKAIEYMCDIKVRVHRFRAFPRCRYGGNQPYTIWDKKQDLTLFNPKI